MNPRGEDRLGTTDGNVMIQLPNGFTKGTSVHTLGPDVNTTAELRWHKPYVSRYFPLKVLYFIVLLLLVLVATQRKEVFTQDNLLGFASFYLKNPLYFPCRDFYERKRDVTRGSLC